MIETFPISKTREQEANRLGFLPRHLGTEYVRFEQFVFKIAHIASPDYGGGVWDLFNLSNGGFFIAPAAVGPLSVNWPVNGFEGALSAQALGIGSCMIVLSGLSHQSADTAQMATKYFALREFAMQHPERNEILGFAD